MSLYLVVDMLHPVFDQGDGAMTRPPPALERPAGLALVVPVLTILLGAFWTSYDPIAIDLAHPFMPPSAALAGIGPVWPRCPELAMLGRAHFFSIALGTVALVIALGTMLGLCAGFLRGWADRAIMRPAMPRQPFRHSPGAG